MSVRNPGAFLEFIANGTSRPVTPVLLYGRLLVIGPTLFPGASPCGRCYAERLLATSPVEFERAARSAVRGSPSTVLLTRG